MDGAPAYPTRAEEIKAARDRRAILTVEDFFPTAFSLIFGNLRGSRNRGQLKAAKSPSAIYISPDRFKSVWIIDGQHRLFGFTEASDDIATHTVPILAFEKLSTVSEAELFTTIQ